VSAWYVDLCGLCFFGWLVVFVMAMALCQAAGKADSLMGLQEWQQKEREDE